MVEIKEAEKIVIAKPVACRPGFSNLKSFSKILSGADNASPPATISGTAVAPIRPRTVRFKPVCNTDLVEAEVFGTAACCPSNRVPETNITPNVVYKPVAKLVSKATVSLLANLGSYGVIPTREITEVGARIQPSDQLKHKTDPTSDPYINSPSQSESNRNTILEDTEHEKKSLLPPSNGDRPNDGHNWRKYGQKQVKGSENPRSYYKCTHPNCPVKKKVEKTLDGQIAEIVYNGEHNHPKPERVEGREGISGNQNNINLSARSNNVSVSTSNNSLAPSGECEEVSESLEAEGGDFKTKRRKRENQLLKASTLGEASFEPQTGADSDTIGDGFRWRKYGQKVVRGNPYPRSYYRCTSPKCNVRKYVERTSEDSGTFISTYEGKHNHDMPVRTTKFRGV
ncbi:hypothetical protein BUALT_Bualt09G0068900 [Buddleja alternifolia]|uniref:WRKY domain-containing protein n=1 Tax=Buddleja alternifolia TaxID=168488 RepID=A0AAV6X4Y6_9LAMI|nr:hypothetical protein BUALT_Bualt09G0068900 [Buddleja alternifolia]